MKSLKTKSIKVQQNVNMYGNTYIKSGFVSCFDFVKNGENGVGGVYQNGNFSRSYIEFSKSGPYIGSLSIADVRIEEINNYLTSLIPGLYPDVSGKYSETESLYNITDAQNSDGNACNVLGLGCGDILNFCVSNVSRNGMGNMANNTSLFSNNSQSSAYPQIKLNWISNLTTDLVFPESSIGTNQYMQYTNWQNVYGIGSINGTNTFPYFGWAGARLGTIRPQTFQVYQESLYNYPASFLQLAKTYEPIGLIYPGQGVQYSSWVVTENATYSEVIENFQKFQYRRTGVVPYQQGRGSYDFYAKEAIYEPNGLIKILQNSFLVPSEGVNPGRNNAFLGVAISDFWSSTLNMNNILAGSNTRQDLSYNANAQECAAHNAPLVYTSPTEDNTYIQLPWQNVLGYNSVSSSGSYNGQHSSNAPIMTEGLTTMVISGAFPLYRGCYNTQWNGLNLLVMNMGNTGYDSYYRTNEFWNAGYVETPNTAITSVNGLAPAVPPENPFSIKGGKILLRSGQRVKAGSYVYSSMNLIGNVTMSQFYASSAKNIILNEGESDFLLGDIYSKYQGNQGGLVVIVSTDSEDPPMIPACCQPVGIVMEEIVGFGDPEYNDGIVSQNLKYEPESSGTSAVNSTYKLVYDESTSCYLQCRNISVKLFPMMAQMASTYATNMNFTFLNILYIGFPITATTGDPADPSLSFANSGYFSPIFNKVRNNFLIQASSEAYYTQQTFLGLNNNDLKTKLLTIDWPPY